MKSILLLGLVSFFCLNASAGYSGIPSYSFQENVETGESATKMAECRKTIEAEKKKITSLGILHLCFVSVLVCVLLCHSPIP